MSHFNFFKKLICVTMACCFTVAMSYADPSPEPPPPDNPWINPIGIAASIGSGVAFLVSIAVNRYIHHQLNAVLDKALPNDSELKNLITKAMLPQIQTVLTQHALSTFFQNSNDQNAIVRDYKNILPYIHPTQRPHAIAAILKIRQGFESVTRTASHIGTYEWPTQEPDNTPIDKSYDWFRATEGDSGFLRGVDIPTFLEKNPDFKRTSPQQFATPLVTDISQKLSASDQDLFFIQRLPFEYTHYRINAEKYVEASLENAPYYQINLATDIMHNLMPLGVTGCQLSFRSLALKTGFDPLNNIFGTQFRYSIYETSGISGQLAIAFVKEYMRQKMSIVLLNAYE